MQKVEQISQGIVSLGPGTLYGAFSILEKEGLIEMVKEEDRRKCYRLTPKGKQILAGQVRRLKIMLENGLSVLDSI
jgi:DNA-binding PadR family transcriptional regulator